MRRFGRSYYRDFSDDYSSFGDDIRNGFSDNHRNSFGDDLGVGGRRRVGSVASREHGRAGRTADRASVQLARRRRLAVGLLRLQHVPTAEPVQRRRCTLHHRTTGPRRPLVVSIQDLSGRHRVAADP